MKIDELTKKYKKYLNFNHNLSSYTWFGVGGIADILFTPENMDQAINFIKEKPKDLSIFTIDVGQFTKLRVSFFLLNNVIVFAHVQHLYFQYNII